MTLENIMLIAGALGVREAIAYVFRQVWPTEAQKAKDDTARLGLTEGALEIAQEYQRMVRDLQHRAKIAEGQVAHIVMWLERGEDVSEETRQSWDARRGPDGNVMLTKLSVPTEELLDGDDVDD